MQNYWTTVITQKQRYEEFAREAQTDRLVRLARRAQPIETITPRRKDLRRRTLGWLGCRMVTLGLRLQGNQGNAAQLTTC